MVENVLDEVGEGIPVPDIFTGILWIYDLCGVSVEEQDIFQKVLCAVRDQLNDESIGHAQLRKARIIFSKDGSYEVKAREKTIRGVYERHIVFPMEYLRGLDREWKYMSFAEELCHHLWNIDNEVEVKYKVAEVLARIFTKCNVHVEMIDDENARVNLEYL